MDIVYGNLHECKKSFTEIRWATVTTQKEVPLKILLRLFFICSFPKNAAQANWTSFQANEVGEVYLNCFN